MEAATREAAEVLSCHRPLHALVPTTSPSSPARRLGMSLEAALGEAAEAQLTPPLLEAWLGTERARQAAQWQPQRAEAAAGA